MSHLGYSEAEDLFSEAEEDDFALSLSLMSFQFIIKMGKLELLCEMC